MWHSQLGGTELALSIHSHHDFFLDILLTILLFHTRILREQLHTDTTLCQIIFTTFRIQTGEDEREKLCGKQVDCNGK